MNLLAQAVLSLTQAPKERLSTVAVLALDQPGDDGSARHVVSLQVTRLRGGLVEQADDGTLTPLPVSLAQARLRALDFLRQRLGCGHVLVSQSGFDELEELLQAASAPPPGLAEPCAQDQAVAALCARLDGHAWRLMPDGQRARLVWRLAEYVDAARGGAAQEQLLAQVPRLIALLESGDDLLDYCLAYLVGRLGDPGAGIAMQALAQRGRSQATRDMARQAWLALLSPEAREAELEPLRARWQQLAPSAQAPGAAPALPSDLDAKGLLLLDELASHEPALSGLLHSLLAVLPVSRRLWPAIRRIYKRAEWRRDAAMLGVLHARFDGVGAQAFDFSRDTWLYMRLRGWRQLRRMAALGHSGSAALAASLLEHMDMRCAQQATSRAGQLPEMRWLLAARLLLPRWPVLHANARAQSWSCKEPLDLQRLPEARVDGLAAMWDDHPRELLGLVVRLQSTLALWSLTRALRDQSAWLAGLDASQAAPLLLHRYGPAASLGLELAQQQLVALDSADGRRPWLLALARCPEGPAARYLSARLSGDRTAAARDAELVAALLLSPSETSRTQGLALLLYADGHAVTLALLAALPALDADDAELAEIRDALQPLFADSAPLARHAAGVPAEPLLHLLAHSQTALVEVACFWLLAHPQGLRGLPATTLRALLASTEVARTACGIRLMASLRDDMLARQAEVLAEFAASPHAPLRAAVMPLIERLAGDAHGNAVIARRLHDALFRAEHGPGLYDDALRMLTGCLAGVAPARDAGGIWRALQAQATGAQRYGAWGLQALEDDAYTLRQWAGLAKHADAKVRMRSRSSLDALLSPMEHVDSEQARQLMPLADALFADTQQYARQLFGERLPAAALSPELLVAWVDHPQDWIQALGRQRMGLQMSAGEASLFLTRLAQHPSTSVQLFVTQWLLSLPEEPAPERARRLARLQPYFLAVLSQVHRARTSKTRVLHFLRSQVQERESAAVVAAIFARQVVSASHADQPEYVAGLRDIVTRHPELAQSFMQALPVEQRGAAVS
ncbi:hypothetical protein [Comamonas composti]|uniref:hypothetical protein n=1 Tax=Comamonas composti TaxID=408558 RepID=UPI00040F0209|nr:hypothetical protein [Comamonas composti]